MNQNWAYLQHDDVLSELPAAVRQRADKCSRSSTTGFGEINQQTYGVLQDAGIFQRLRWNDRRDCAASSGRSANCIFPVAQTIDDAQPRLIG
jgi:hypothetical protein